MQETKVNQLILDIINTLNEPNEVLNENFELQTFKYTGNIKTEADSYKLEKNPAITLIGKNKINQYNKLYKELYEEVEARNKKISFKCFVEHTQQFMFTNDFNCKKILEFINNLKMQTYYCVSPVWGMSLNENFIKLGKYVFINKNYLCEYIKDNTEINDDFITTHSIELIEKWAENPSNFIYVLTGYDTYDSSFAQQLFEQEKIIIVNTLRYMLGFNRDRIYISDTEFLPYTEKHIQFTNKVILTGTKINNKDIEVVLDDNYFNSNENGNKQIWEILSKENCNDFEKRIAHSIQWAGRSLNEEVGNDISISELAFAYETLLKNNVEITPITSSIQGSISECVSYIVGKTLPDRLELMKKFKTFYKKRSAVVHGGVTEKDINLYYEFLYVFKVLIKIILTQEPYNSCPSTEELYKKLNEYKFRI